MTGVFHLWLKPVEPLYSKHREGDPERADFAKTNNLVFIGYPPSLDVFLYEVNEGDLIVARCDGFCGIGRAVGAPTIRPGAKARGRVPHFRQVEWLSVTSRGTGCPYEPFLRGLAVHEAVKDITAHCGSGPISDFL
ncbi:hypothetical protein [Methylopila sp. M107]|uniref:hypothetical protein n=1 Tax=Methylopila sp. M107 TaxID=1101190 RepID=UPI000376C653|nr:hypothetical protein [Methylopila sp. M107]